MKIEITLSPQDLQQFREELPGVALRLGHSPVTLVVEDDGDVTQVHSASRDWSRAAAGKRFSKDVQTLAAWARKRL